LGDPPGSGDRKEEWTARETHAAARVPGTGHPGKPAADRSQAVPSLQGGIHPGFPQAWPRLGGVAGGNRTGPFSACEPAANPLVSAPVSRGVRPRGQTRARP
jgi:hypothetical protein